MPQLPITIDRNSGTPIHVQIVESFSNLIQNKELKPGERLLSMRDLARSLGVNRNTVGLAYTELESIGLVQTRVGSGTYVIEANQGRDVGRSLPPGGAGRGGERLEHALSRRTRQGDALAERLSGGDGDTARIELGGLIPDRELFPAEEFRLVLSDVVKEMGPVILDYGSREGYRPLRRWLAERLSGMCGEVEEENLFIVNGSQQGLDLVAKLLLDEGDTVVVEGPTYHNAIGVFRLYGANLRPVPLDGNGMRADMLGDILEGERVKLIYCMPTFQNPTGVTMPLERREEIVAAAARHGVPVLEDNFGADLRYSGDEQCALRSLRGGENGLLLGTFSKILFPGLRLGWLVLPSAFREPFRTIRAYTDLSAGQLVQAAIHRFCEMGYLDDHLEKVRRENGARLGAMTSAMETHFPEGVSWTVPDGGMSLWVTLPRGIDSMELLMDARREGVNFAPGVLFHAGGGGRNEFRLSFTVEKEERIAAGIAALGELLRRRIATRRAGEWRESDVLL